MIKSTDLCFYFNHDENPDEFFFWVFFRSQKKNETKSAADKIFEWVEVNVPNVEHQAEFLFSISGALSVEGKTLYDLLIEKGLTFDIEAQNYIYEDSPNIIPTIEKIRNEHV